MRSPVTWPIARRALAALLVTAAMLFVAVGTALADGSTPIPTTPGPNAATLTADGSPVPSPHLA